MKVFTPLLGCIDASAAAWYAHVGGGGAGGDAWLLFLLVVVLQCNGVSSVRVLCLVFCVLILFLFLVCVHLHRCVVALGRGPRDRACVLVQCGW